jgi:hypothetical protein
LGTRQLHGSTHFAPRHRSQNSNAEVLSSVTRQLHVCQKIVRTYQSLPGVSGPTTDFGCNSGFAGPQRDGYS